MNIVNIFTRARWILLTYLYVASDRCEIRHNGGACPNHLMLTFRRVTFDGPLPHDLVHSSSCMHQVYITSWSERIQLGTVKLIGWCDWANLHKRIKWGLCRVLCSLGLQSRFNQSCTKWHQSVNFTVSSCKVVRPDTEAHTNCGVRQDRSYLQATFSIACVEDCNAPTIHKIDVFKCRVDHSCVFTLFSVQSYSRQRQRKVFTAAISPLKDIH